jgi:hypothetical protein
MHQYNNIETDIIFTMNVYENYSNYHRNNNASVGFMMKWKQIENENDFWNYNDLSITNTTFIVEDAQLANLMRKNLKAYNALEVTGVFKSTVITETVEAEDDWGQKSSFDRVSVPRKFEMYITGAKPSTIDRETYTEDNIAEARKAIANKDKVETNYGEKKETTTVEDGWGDTSDDDNEPW